MVSHISIHCTILDHQCDRQTDGQNYDCSSVRKRRALNRIQQEVYWKWEMCKDYVVLFQKVTSRQLYA